METGNQRVFVGAETGLLKAIDPDTLKWENVTKIETVKRSNGICVMCWENQQEENILYGTVGGVLSNYNIPTKITSELFRVTENEDQVLKGIYTTEGKYVTCTGDGKLSVWDPSEAQEENYKPFVAECGTGICRMRPCPTNTSIACTGGKENDLKLWDISQLDKGPVFTAKNVPYDFLDLRVPIWICDMTFLESSSDTHIIATCTRHHQVRLYDTRAKNQPVIDMEWLYNPITTMCTNPHSDRQVMLGNAVGDHGVVDLRTKRTVYKYKGGSGSVRGIAVHPTKPITVATGLDRYVRVYDLNSRILLNRVYVKSRINTLLLSTIWDKLESKDSVNVEDDAVEACEVEEVKSEPESAPEDDEIWAEIEGKSHTRKHKPAETPEVTVTSKKTKKIVKIKRRNLHTNKKVET